MLLPIIFVEFELENLDRILFFKNSKSSIRSFDPTMFRGTIHFIDKEKMLKVDAPIFEFLLELLDGVNFLSNTDLHDFEVHTSNFSEKKLKIVKGEEEFKLILNKQQKVEIENSISKELMGKVIEFTFSQSEYYFPFLNFDFKYIEYKIRLKKLVSTISV